MRCHPVLCEISQEFFIPSFVTLPRRLSFYLLIRQSAASSLVPSFNSSTSQPLRLPSLPFIHQSFSYFSIFSSLNSSVSQILIPFSNPLTSSVSQLLFQFSIPYKFTSSIFHFRTSTVSQPFRLLPHS